MPTRRILIADDNAQKLASLTQAAASAQPDAIILTATSVREATAIIATQGANIDTGIIDFDFEFDRGCTGADIIRDLRSANGYALIVCATARDGEALTEASDLTMPAGANVTLSYLQKDFLCELWGVLR